MKRNTASWRHFVISTCLLVAVGCVWADDDAEEALEQSMTAEIESEDEDEAFERAEHDIENSLEEQFEGAEELEDELEERLERMFEARSHGDDDFITQGIEDHIHQLWQLEEMLDESGFEETEENKKSVTNVLTYLEEEIEGMLVQNADEPYAKEIASAIIAEYRTGNLITTTSQLQSVIERALDFIPKSTRDKCFSSFDFSNAFSFHQ